ncbi:MAG: ABC transporter substrate-binding protein [Acidimicrobiia bacterium]
MSNESQVMALLEEGNPATEVADTAWLGIDAAAYLATLEPRSSEVTQLETESKDEKRSMMPWLVAAAAAVILGAAIVLVTQNTEEAPPATQLTPSTIADAAPTTVADVVPTTEAALAATVRPPSGEPIIIGAAIDQSQHMAAVDGPANLAAQIMVERINANGGVLGRPLKLITIDTALDPDQTKSAALDLIEQRAVMLMVTCDFDSAAPAIQEAVTHAVLAVAPCIGTDRMGPKELGEVAGHISFSFGNVAQDEGAVLAEFAMDRGWEKAVVVKDNLRIYFQDVVDAFDVRFQELGGTVVATEEFTGFDGTIENVATAVVNTDKDVIVISSGVADMAAFVSGVRNLGDDTPILCSSACDGTFWVPEGVSGLYYNASLSVFGDDPSDVAKEFIAEMTARSGPPATSGFLGGAEAIQAFAEAVEATGTDQYDQFPLHPYRGLGTDSVVLADFIESFSNKPTLFGEISFSPENHTVFARSYRIMLFTDSLPALEEIRSATSPADTG